MNLEQRVAALEKIIADSKPFAPIQFIVLDIGRDDPEEYERKLQRIAEIEASGGSRNGEPNLIVYSVIF